MGNEKMDDLYKSIENLDNEIITLTNKKENISNDINKFINITNEVMLIYAILTFFLAIAIRINISFLYSLIVFLVALVIGLTSRTIMNKKFKLKEKEENILKINDEINFCKNRKKDLIKELDNINNKNNKEVINYLDEKLDNIRKEKEELIKLKNLLYNDNKTINITNVYVYEPDNENIKYIVKLVERNFRSPMTVLCDIFSNNELYEEMNNISNIKIRGISKCWGKITPIYKYEPALLAYPEKLVPEYVLREIYYNINNIDLNAPILRKK